jgi:hypothetical protein
MSMREGLLRGRAVGIVLAVLGLAAWAYGYTTMRQVALQSYMYGFMLWASLAGGCFALTLLHSATRATWSRPVIRLFEAGGGAPALIAIGIMFIPIALSLPQIYPWADPAKVQADHILQMKTPYLNQAFFIGRSVGYFVVWALFAAALRRSSLREDVSKDPAETDRRANIGAPGLVLTALTVNFAATDWVMSLEPHWYSSIYGIWFLAQMALTALAFGAGFVVLNFKKQPYSDLTAQAFQKDVGTMLFATVMFWAYITLSQFLIIYAANLPEFTPYYISRSHGGWDAIAWFVIVGGFFVPFMALLAPRTRQTVGLLLVVVVLLLAVRVLDVYWIVMPSMRKDGLNFQWTDVAAAVGIGGVWLSVFATQAAKAPLVPIRAPRTTEEEGLEHA